VLDGSIAQIGMQSPTSRVSGPDNSGHSSLTQNPKMRQSES
jgi:hypothetical protein